MERTAGIDLASEEHRLCVVEQDGRRREERRYRHSEEGIAALVRRPSTAARSIGAPFVNAAASITPSSRAPSRCDGAWKDRA
ncbi:MAG: hypothetical protein C4327_06435 [Meiothermus sp.]